MPGQEVVEVDPNALGKYHECNIVSHVRKNKVQGMSYSELEQTMVDIKIRPAMSFIKPDGKEYQFLSSTEEESSSTGEEEETFDLDKLRHVDVTTKMAEKLRNTFYETNHAVSLQCVDGVER